MRKQKLPDLINDLDKELLRLGYKESTMSFYRQMWKRILKFATDENEQYFSMELGMRYLDINYDYMQRNQSGTLRQSDTYALRVIRMLADYQLNGTVIRKYVPKYEVLRNTSYLQIVDKYIGHCQKLNYSKVTQSHYIKNAKTFLAFLESQRCLSCGEINTQHIFDFINTFLGYSYKTVELALCSTRSFLRFLYLNNIHSEDLSQNTPSIKVRKQNRIPSVWTQENVKKLLSAIDTGNPSGKRDYAIILLVARLGLRTLDVKRLKLNNLKWQDNKIVFTQSKTSQEISLPLLQDVGWTIIDYLKNGRPKVGSPYVFLRHLAPFKPFLDENRLYDIIVKHMRLAKIPVSSQKKVGMHSLRHTLASVLLEKNTPLSVISEILGHSDTDSIAVYLKINTDMLQECAINPGEVY